MASHLPHLVVAAPGAGVVQRGRLQGPGAARRGRSILVSMCIIISADSLYIRRAFPWVSWIIIAEARSHVHAALPSCHYSPIVTCRNMRSRRATAAAAALFAGTAFGARSLLSAGCRPQARETKPGTAAHSAFDVAVVGGGVVGLAVAREMAVRGRTVVLLEREDALAAGASSGNSGIGCTGYDAPVGSLERRLLRRAIQLHPSLLRSFGMSYEHVRKCGSLVVAWTPEQLAALPRIVAENREAGDAEAVQLTAAELHALEPALSTAALGAVLCPRESVVEPWLVPAGYAHSARLNGADLRMSTEVIGVDYSEGLWKLQTRRASSASSGRSAPGQLLVPKPEPERPPPREGGETVCAHAVVNCAGLFGDTVEQMRVGQSAESVGFTVTPRKGQFVVFAPPPPLESGDDAAPAHIIEPVPTEFTKVYTLAIPCCVHMS
jgi:glycine/D-amino acid oxidase-like deaminating enzyme